MKLGKIAAALLFAVELWLIGTQPAEAVAAATWKLLSSSNGDLPVPNGGLQQTAAIVCDLDRDGTNDFVITERTATPSVVWYRRAPTGWTKYVVDNTLLKLEAGGTFGDVDGDGDVDIVVGNDASGPNVFWWENPYPNYATNTPWTRRLIKNSGSNKHHDLIFGDFKGTGQTQLVFWNQGAKKLFLADIPANPKNTQPWPYVEIYGWNTGQEHEGLVAADVDADGKLDIVGGGRWFKHTGGNSFNAYVIDDAQRFTRAAAGFFKPSTNSQVVFVASDLDGPIKWYECLGNPTQTASWIGHSLLGANVIHGHTLQLGDINCDGHLDIFCAEMARWTGAAVDNPDAKARIFYGDGQGNFTLTELARGFDFHEGKLADLDGDLDLDLLDKPYNFGTPRVDVWLQNGTGEVPFAKTNVDNTPPSSPYYKMLGDVDGDGQLDIIIGGSSGPLVWYRYPTWTKTQIASGGWDGVNGEAVDLDGDGDIDIVMGGVVWFRNPRIGGGNWTMLRIDTQRLHDIEVGDLDGDGKLDVVGRDQSAFGNAGNVIYVYRQLDSTNWTKRTFACPHGEGVKLGDIDRDGDPDIIIGGRWYENEGDPINDPWTEHIYTTNYPDPDNKVVMADWNGDGRPDIVLSPAELAGGTNKIAWYEAPPDAKTGNWPEHIIVPSVETVIHGLAVADFDLDGDMDVAYAEMHQGADPDEVCVMLNLGGGISWHKQLISTNGSHDIAVGDIGGDGDMDIIGANHAGSYQPVELWENKLHQKLSLDSWQRRIVDPARPDRGVFITSQDLDQDGLKDIITGAWWYRNPGSPGGDWTRNPIGSPLNNMAAIYDFDNDGDLDILGTRGLGSASDARFVWARNNGSGLFTILTNITAGDGDFLQGVALDRFPNGGPLEVALSWHAANKGIQMLTVPSDPVNQTWAWRQISSSSQDEQLSSGDLDLDGDRDLMLGTRWLRNDPGAWNLFTVNPVSGDPDRNRLADINRDGRLDVVVGFEAISIPGKLAWYEAPTNATTTWAEHIISTNVVGPMSIDVADMDSDGDLDVIVGEHNLANPSTARLLVFENLDGFGVSWTNHVVYTGDEHHDGAQVVDIDNDGDLDIISLGWGHLNTVLYENRAISASVQPSLPVVSLYVTDATCGEAGPDVGAFVISRTGDTSSALSVPITIAGSAANAVDYQILPSLVSIPTGVTSVPLVITPIDDTAVESAETVVLALGSGSNYAVGAASAILMIIDNDGGTNVAPPINGLQLWLRGDVGVTINGSGVSQWADQSGNGRHATQTAGAAQPALLPSALNGRPSLHFDGANDFLTFDLPVTGLTGMTLALVSRCAVDQTGGSSEAQYCAVFWNETASWGTVYLAPFQTRVNFRFGTTQTGNLPTYFPATSLSNSWNTFISRKSTTNDSLYVNGTLAVSENGKLTTIAQCRDTGNLGRGHDDNTFFAGDIAEVLVYNRALSVPERQQVEGYVQAKFFQQAPRRLNLHANDGQAVFSWSVALQGYGLESATDLGAADWSAVTTPPAPLADDYWLTLPIGADMRFYRLKK